MFEGIDFSGFDKVEKNQQKAKATQPAPSGHVELLLTEVIEDPEQPRRRFSDDSLNELAESIKQRGVLQPIVVRPKNSDGQYVIVMGARRYRASQLANVGKIPAIIRVKPSDGYDQMIENIQRENLLHGDIAHFIEQQLARGEKAATIASSLGKPRSWVSLYTGFSQMHETVRDRVEELGIRVAYELQNAIEVNEAATLAYIENAEVITQRGVMAFAKALKGAPRIEQPSIEPDPIALLKAADAAQKDKGVGEMGPITPAFERRVPEGVKHQSSSIVIIVQANERVGRLLLGRSAQQGSRFGVVSFNNGTLEEEVLLDDIRIIEILQIES